MKPNDNELELLCIIVNYGMARKIIKCGKQYGITGGTVFWGKGTINRNNKLLEFLDLSEVRKEIILMLMDQRTGYLALDELNNKFKFDKPHHGIAFSIPVSQILGSSQYSDQKETGGILKSMYKAIFTIIDRGKAEDVIKAATLAGSKGGTIINARGSGIHETSKLFNMEIAPEKEIVLILSESHLTDSITTAIREKLQIDEPGNGIIFVQDVNKTYGLY